jgi:hypothetical protein
MSKSEVEVVEVESETKDQEVPPGPRGELGVATTSLTIKQQWHEATHVLEDVGDRHNPRKQEWVRKAGTPSLKQYARQLLASGNELAKDWFARKGGSMNAKRSDSNLSRASAEATASRAARRKKSDANKNKAKAAEAPATIVTKK